MPDRATIEAATPKCPAGPDQSRSAGLPFAPEACRRLLTYDDAQLLWSCPVHGPVTTTQSLVARQTPLDPALLGPGA